MGKLLVTGGAGFIGSAVVDAAIDNGWEVVVVDCLHPAAHAGEPDYLNSAAEYVWGDVNDEDLMRQVCADVDAVSHQAAMVGLGTDFNDVVDYARDNDLGTATLLKVLNARIFRGRLVLASSMVVYGEGRYVCAEHGLVPAAPRSTQRLDQGRFEPPCPECGADLVAESVPESAPTDPRNVYAATKLHQEHLSSSFARESGASVVALRYHNVYGPRMPRSTPYAGVASIFRSALEEGRAPQVFEDGGQIRDFIHVSDIARANIAALESPPGTFNVCSGTPHTVKEMAEALHAAYGSAPPPVVTGAYRLGDVRHVFASPDLASSELGFTAEIGFADGMREFAGASLR